MVWRRNRLRPRIDGPGSPVWWRFASPADIQTYRQDLVNSAALVEQRIAEGSRFIGPLTHQLSNLQSEIARVDDRLAAQGA